jgi:vacuolar-type H+-ATPase subunit I/STV1
MQSQEVEQSLLGNIELGSDPERAHGGYGTQLSEKSLAYVCGVIEKDKEATFHRVLFRVTRGNIFANFIDIPDERQYVDMLGNKVLKRVFVVYYTGEVMKNKVSKICAAFGATRYDYPDDSSVLVQKNRAVLIVSPRRPGPFRSSSTAITSSLSEKA